MLINLVRVKCCVLRDHENTEYRFYIVIGVCCCNECQMNWVRDEITFKPEPERNLDQCFLLLGEGFRSRGANIAVSRGKHIRPAERVAFCVGIYVQKGGRSGIDGRKHQFDPQL